MPILHAGLRILIGLLPVFAFLLALILLDSFKLLKLRTVAGLIVAGGLAAYVSLLINSQLSELLVLDGTTVARYIAPAVEEILKAPVSLRSRTSIISWLSRRTASRCGWCAVSAPP